MAELDTVEDTRVHERLAEADQHHVLGRIGGFADQPLEDRVRHIGFGLRVGLARAHRAIEIAFGGGLDDVFDRQRAERRPPPQIAPQKLRPVPRPHEPLLYPWRRLSSLVCR